MSCIRVRIEIVTFVLENEMDYKSAISKYCVKYQSIYSWTKRYLSNGNEDLKDNKRGPKNYSVNLDSLSEIERLKHELEVERKKREFAELKVEVLKKKQDIEEKLYRK